MADDEGPSTTSPGFIDRYPSWAYLAAFAGVIGLAFVLSWTAPSTFWDPPEDSLVFDDPRCNSYTPGENGLFYDYWWVPILCDAGYNVFNTIILGVTLGFILLWAYRLMSELRENVTTGLVFAALPYIAWGSIYRVLEDADLFTPYEPNSGITTGTGWLDQYLGVFFITPIIYVWVVFLAIAFLLWGRKAQRVAETVSLTHGLRYYAYTLVAMTATYAALWAADPNIVRFWAPPWVAVAGALIAYWPVHRYATARREFNAHLALGAYGLWFLVLGIYYVVVWMMSAAPTWQPGPAADAALEYPLATHSGIIDWPVQWWVYLAFIVAPALVMTATWLVARQFSGFGRKAPALDNEQETPGRPVTFLIAILLAQTIAVFLTITGMSELAQRQIANDWSSRAGDYTGTFAKLAIGPIAVWLGSLLAGRLAQNGAGWHPHIIQYALPVNLLMVFGQMSDALMTSLGIDLYNYHEKHVLPRYLIERVDALGLPAPFGAFPTAMVMLPLKLLIVLLVVLAIDLSPEARKSQHQNLVMLIKLAIIMVGLAPGLRDAVRLAMAV